MFKYIILTIHSCLAFAAFSQTVDKKVEAISLKYFGISPIGKTIDSVINELLVTKKIEVECNIKQTDSTNFYFKGYSSYNPFPVNFNKTMYILETIINKNTKNNIPDSLVTFWMIVYSDGSDNGKKLVRKQYNKLVNEFSFLFKHSNHQWKKENTKMEFERMSFYEWSYVYPAISISWGKAKNENGYSLAIYYHFPMESQKAKDIP